MTGVFDNIGLNLAISITLLFLIPALTTIAISKFVGFPKKPDKRRVWLLALVFFVTLVTTLFVLRIYQDSSFIWLFGYIVCIIVYWLLKKRRNAGDKKNLYE